MQPGSSAISLAGAGKRYTKYEDAPMLVTAALKFRQRTRRSRLWAVRDIDLEVAPGECVGIIGRNGSGKSTLLQMLAGVTAPTEGRVTVRGRVAPLISVGVGFHPELTGRENIYLNATILGLSRREIDARLEEIIDFAEIGPFIDTPVKFYSSGMYVRLGFAVAIQAEPNILLVDEVLAVGDLAFQMKCFDKMTEQRRAGTTVVVVSHNLNAVRLICDRAMVLHYGENRFVGPTDQAISLFHELLGEHREPDGAADPTQLSAERGLVEVESFALIGAEGAPTHHARSGDEVTFRVALRFLQAVSDPVLGFSLRTDKGQGVYADSSPVEDSLGTYAAGDRATFDIRMPLPLVTGSYAAYTGVRRMQDNVELAAAGPLTFYVSGRTMAVGVTDLRASFTLAGAGTAEIRQRRLRELAD
jgi:ABC-type polysaccharide/polyol phosphate transport system ATPase subunit